MNLFRRFLALFVISDADRYRNLLADIKRDEWANLMASTRDASPRKMRALLAACKDDYACAERCLVAWDILAAATTPHSASMQIMDAIRKGHV